MIEYPNFHIGTLWGQSYWDQKLDSGAELLQAENAVAHSVSFSIKLLNRTGDKIRENEQCESALRTNGSATNATPSQWKFLGVEQIESHYEDFKKKSLFDDIFSNNFSEII